MQQTDLDIGRSFDRLNRSEEYKARALGRGLNKQGQALTRKYLPQLSEVIAADRAASRRDRSLWLVLKDIDHEALALRLLIAGISATGVGVDDNGDKDFRHQCLWIGRNLLDGRRHKRELQFKLGAWGAKMLLTLPAFAPVGDILTLAAVSWMTFLSGPLEIIRCCHRSPRRPNHGQTSEKAAYPPTIGRTSH